MAEKEYISREEAIEWLYDNSNLPIDSGTARAYWTRVVQIKDALIRHIKTIPAADVVEVRHGEWNEEEYPFCNVCMNCGLVIDRTCIKYNSGKLNLCPNCGAKMDGGKHETD